MEFGQYIFVALVAALVLGPREMRRSARQLGKWLYDVRKMSHEFTSELKREADLIELRESAREIEKTIAGVKGELRESMMKDYHAETGPAAPAVAAPAQNPAETSGAETASAPQTAVGAES